MRTQNEPMAYGFLAGALILLLGLLVNDGCARHVAPCCIESPVADEEARAVVVDTECGRASGVLVDSTHVLTAHHVVNCDDYPMQKLAKTVTVTTVRGETRKARYDVLDPERDLARLEIPVVGVDRVHFRAAREYGAAICIAAAFPEPKRICGTMGHANDSREHGDMELDDTDVWFGNSGSGVYDDSGHLLGLLVRLHWCSTIDASYWAEAHKRPRKTCGGNMTSLYDSPVWL